MADSNIQFAKRDQRPAIPWEKQGGGGGPGGAGDPASGGPRRPEVDMPDIKRLLERMRHVDREQAKRYRQRTGE